MSGIKSKLRKISIWMIGLFFCGIILVLCCNQLIEKRAKGYLFSATEQLPANEVALVLGTIPLLPDGRKNLYFERRMDAAALLFRTGKVKHLLLSGDNSRKEYNEPEAMQESLIARGVPKSSITLDYAGFRTLDSVVRCREVFQRDKFTLISQAFHNERALFIARSFGMNVIAFNAGEVSTFKRSRLLIREYLARTKAVLDVYILRKQPKFLGEKIDIEI